MAGRWTKRRTHPSVQTFDCAPCEAEVIGAPIDAAQAEEQLRHANQQLELQSQYPGRNRERGPNKVFALQTRPD
jgi:hypothetical protein